MVHYTVINVKELLEHESHTRIGVFLTRIISRIDHEFFMNYLFACILVRPSGSRDR